MVVSISVHVSFPIDVWCLDTTPPPLPVSVCSCVSIARRIEQTPAEQPRLSGGLPAGGKSTAGYFSQ